VQRLLGRIAARGPQARGPDADIAIQLDAAPALPPRPPAEPIGRHRLAEGGAAHGIGLAFGHAQATDLVALAAGRDIDPSDAWPRAAGVRRQ